ncbi:MAG: hypothetical protein IPG25_09390 [Proteobacteria bacterium]|nr:hypothetical protein [Pseudomonadota bacterium]
MILAEPEDLQLLDGLDIDQAKKTAIQAELKAATQAARESMGIGHNLTAPRAERMQAITNNILRNNLADGEYKQVQTAISERASVTRVDAYKTTADGKRGNRP